MLVQAIWAQCGTPPPTPKQYAHIRDIVANYDVSALRNAGTTCVPMQAHVVRMNDGSGGVTLEELNIGLSFLNYRFYDAGIEFFWKAMPNYVDNDDYYDYDQTSPDSDSESGLVGLFATATDAVNIYFVNSIITGSGFVAAGYAYYPCNSAVCNRVVMRHASTASSSNGTFVHEFGHFFDLPHTHNGTEFGNTDPNAENVPRTGLDANCLTDGDLICDTEADPRYNNATFDFGTCMYTGTETDVNGVTYTPPVENIMSYYPDACGGLFTPGQYVRMMQGLIDRQSHTAYNLNASPMIVTAASGLTAVLNGSAVDLTWTDNAGNEMGYLIERSEVSATMGFKALSGGATGQNGNAWTDLDIASSTNYWYRVKASNGDCNSYSNVFAISVPVIYCSANSNTCDEFISRVQLNSIDNTTTCSAGGYGDHLATSTTLSAGSGYTITITNGPPTYTGDQCGVWVDWDQDGSFDGVGEEITIGGGIAAFTGTINVPVTALSGTTRMRVRITYTGAVDPCGTTQFGEVEDYSINVTGGVSAEITIAAKIYLEGPYNSSMMNDDLRVAALIPTNEPYTAIFGHVGDGGGETVSSGVLSTTGGDAIVDWVYVELRDKNDNSSVVNTRSALLQRDGDVVDTDGISPVSFTSSPADDHYVAIRHRNHLGTMSLNPVPMNPAGSIDFTTTNLNSYGTLAQKDLGSGIYGLWMGNCKQNVEIKYTGVDNDRDPILQRIGGSVPTAVLPGYFPEDANLNGEVKYTGSGNDRDPILVNIGGSIPTAVKLEQLP